MKTNLNSCLNYPYEPQLHIIDDDAQMCDLLVAYTSDDFSVCAYQNAHDFLKSAINDQDIVILDLKMPDIDGIEVIRKLAKINKNCSLIIISGYDEGVLHSALQLAKEYGLNAITDLTKPLNFTYLMDVLHKIQTKLTLVASNTVDLKKDKDVKSICSISCQCHFKPNAGDLQKAIEAHHLELFYQPQLSFKDNSLLGVEALVRWNHPFYGIIPPDRFINLAEKSGLIGALTKEVITLAINQIKLWSIDNRNIKISVNISAQNITSLTLPEQLESLVNHSEIEPSMLMLEITETELMTELTTSLDILTRLRLKGFQLSIDDFGTGYSSLSHLHRVPFTELKIDRSFTMEMAKNIESRAIVETCILLGHNLNMEVIAEGVENEETWTLLKQMGCDNAQGYYISKPLPIEQFEQWLVEYNA